MDAPSSGGYAWARMTPDVGDEAPDFTLLDTAGVPRRLADFAAERDVVLVFYRGHW